MSDTTPRPDDGSNPVPPGPQEPTPPAPEGAYPPPPAGAYPPPPAGATPPPPGGYPPPPAPGGYGGDQSVDVVLSSLMLHHLPDEAKIPAFREARRVLRPGGRLHVLDFLGENHTHGLAVRRTRRDPQPDADLDAIPALVRAAGIEVASVTPVQTRLGSFVLVAART